MIICLNSDKIIEVAPHTISSFKLKYGRVTGIPLRIVYFWV